MKVIEKVLPKSLKEIHIVTLADLHIGDELCNLKKIKEVITEISKSKNTYVICNGDYCNNATKTSVSDVYGEQLTPTEQILKICEVLEPIKDKILVFATGNHEDRTYKQDGVDISLLVARQLGIENVYANGWWYLFLALGRVENRENKQVWYKITGVHGYGGGRKMGGKINNLVEMSDKCVADIYVMSHTHTPIITRNSIFIPDEQHHTVKKHEKYYLMTNSFLEYGGYGEKYGYTPSSTDIQEAILDGTKKKIKIIM